MVRLLVRTVLIGLLLAAAPALAQAPFPSRTITMVVPLPAGGTADILARIAAEQMREVLGQNVVVENRPGGAGGLVGTESVFRATPDGYTILCAPQLTFSIATKLNPRMTFDPGTMEPVSILATYPSILLVRPDLPVNSTAELVAYAKANPGKLNYGSQGTGQIGHLAIEQLKHMAKVDLVHVPFRGSAPAITALLGGQIDVLPDLLPATKVHIEAGKMKLIGVASRERMKAFPNVPAIAETLPGFEADTWMGIVAPPGTPKEVAKKLSDAIGQGFRKPEVHDRIARLDVEPRGTSPGEMRDLIQQSADRWGPLVQAAKIAIE
jgi:tripartite-type tricarboxylate transporter receptor subunit TctC